jgi:hypothetical protein
MPEAKTLFSPSSGAFAFGEFDEIGKANLAAFAADHGGVQFEALTDRALSSIRGVCSGRVRWLSSREDGIEFRMIRFDDCTAVPLEAPRDQELDGANCGHARGQGEVLRMAPGYRPISWQAIDAKPRSLPSGEFKQTDWRRTSHAFIGGLTAQRPAN